MKVLMFGWEYPPHVFGGLATANYGISEGLKAQGDMDITLCLPHPFGDESQHATELSFPQPYMTVISLLSMNRSQTE